MDKVEEYFNNKNLTDKDIVLKAKEFTKEYLKHE